MVCKSINIKPMCHNHDIPPQPSHVYSQSRPNNMLPLNTRVLSRSSLPMLAAHYWRLAAHYQRLAAHYQKLAAHYQFLQLTTEDSKAVLESLLGCMVVLCSEMTPQVTQISPPIDLCDKTCHIYFLVLMETMRWIPWIHIYMWYMQMKNTQTLREVWESLAQMKDDVNMRNKEM